MTNLRDRIAEAIWQELRTQHNMVNFDRLSDARIRELERQECALPYQTDTEKPLTDRIAAFATDCVQHGELEADYVLVPKTHTIIRQHEQDSR